MTDRLQGIKGKRGRLLGKNSFYAILTNERYIGIYTWNKKKCKLFRKRTPNPAVVRLEGVAPPLKAYLLSMDFIETAQYIMGQVNDASPNLSAEKTELVQVSTQINNGVKAILSGLDVPELKEELDRLRVRRPEPKDIIARRSSDRPEADPAAIVQDRKSVV